MFRAPRKAVKLVMYPPITSKLILKEKRSLKRKKKQKKMEKLGASWTYDYNKKEMISFDTEQVARWKGDWIRREGLRGSMFWELSGDKGSPRDGMEGGPGKEPQPGHSLVAVVKEAMGELDRSPNWLQYEGSQYDNMRAGMP